MLVVYELIWSDLLIICRTSCFPAPLRMCTHVWMPSIILWCIIDGEVRYKPGSVWPGLLPQWLPWWPGVLQPLPGMTRPATAVIAFVLGALQHSPGIIRLATAMIACLGGTARYVPGPVWPGGGLKLDPAASLNRGPARHLPANSKSA